LARLGACPAGFSALSGGQDSPFSFEPHEAAHVDRFGRPGKGNDKGKVEGLVKFARANFMTPIPVVASFDVLNAMLAERCRARQAERAGRHADTIGERLAADTAALPIARFCRWYPSRPIACGVGLAQGCSILWTVTHCE
jgi:hypothetical protein